MKYLWSVLGLGIIIAVVLMVVDRSNRPTETSSVTRNETPTNANSTAPSPGAESTEKPALAGTELAANYYAFARADFDALVEADVPIHLFFYANWCPTCAAQDPIHTALFTELGADNPVVGLRVNFNDSDTDDHEKALAKEFGVRYQHTLITLDANGNETSRLIGQTSKTALLEALTGAQ